MRKSLYFEDPRINYPVRRPRFVASKQAYELWIEYMRRIPNYGRRHPLYKDFRNINVPFEQWWKARATHVFAEAPTLNEVRMIYNLKQVEQLEKESFLIAVPTNWGRRRVLKEINRVLEKHMSRRRGARVYARSTARYPLARPPIVHALRKVLKVYDWKQQGLTHREVAAKLGLSQDPAVAKVMISRYYAQAKQYIRGVSQGEFPKRM